MYLSCLTEDEIKTVALEAFHLMALSPKMRGGEPEKMLTCLCSVIDPASDPAFMEEIEKCINAAA